MVTLGGRSDGESEMGFRRAKAAIRLHTLLDLRGDIPAFIWITDGKVHDINILDYLIPEPSAIYVMDRGYLDYQRLHRMYQGSAISKLQHFRLNARHRI